MKLKRDLELGTIEEISERIRSIEAQRERLCSRDTTRLTPAASSQLQTRIAGLTFREGVLWARRAKLLKGE